MIWHHLFDPTGKINRGTCGENDASARCGLESHKQRGDSRVNREGPQTTVLGWEGMERPEQWFITVDRGRPEVKGGTVRVTGQHRKWDTH